MIFADLIALGAMIISVMMFLYLAMQGATKTISIENVLLASRSAGSTQFGASFAAASTSLATVLIFFISYSSFFGLSLLWCGTTYLLGQILFIRFMKRINVETSNLTTNADFVLQYVHTERTAKAMAALTASAFILILFLELYIGSEIISYYLTNLGSIGKAVAFLSLGLIVIMYVRIGGLTVVFRTDIWQLSILIAACIGLLLFSIIYEPITSGISQATKPILFANATPVQILIFMLWIFVLNLTLPFTQLSSWQRLAATKSIDQAWRGLKLSTPGFLVIWILPVIALVILNAKGVIPNSLSGLFDVLRTGDTELANILYPIIFVGFASALFSTADTAMIALQFSFSDNATFGDRLKSMDEKKLGKVLTSSTIFIIIILAVIYGVAEAQLGSWFIPLVYTIFSQLTIIAPQVIYAMLEVSGKIPEREFQVLSDRINISGIGLAWIVLVGATIGKVYGILPQAGTQEVATYIALIISTVGQIVAAASARRLDENKIGG